MPETNAADPDNFVAPVVIRHGNVPEEQLDDRPDFEGRHLPAAHLDGAEGDDRISADMAFGEVNEGQAGENTDVPLQQQMPLQIDPAPEPPEADATQDDGVQSTPATGIGGLFGWGNRSAKAVEEVEASEPPSEIVEEVDEYPEPAPFDDEDLEIPAFLRRSANH